MHYVPARLLGLFIPVISVRLPLMICGIDPAGCEELPESSIITRRGYLCV